MEIRDPAQPPGARKYQQEQLYKLAPKLHDHCCNYGGTTVSLCSTRMKSGADFSYSFTGCLMSDALIFRDLMNEVLKGGKRKILFLWNGQERPHKRNGVWTYWGGGHSCRANII